ncbi:Nck-associated protein 5 [Holothuria leucospilota]|uniref:Nck-associated protein 5 n=1 Tax=Holothuria leucospilota TaxID=206669 RepID=A0A9Q1B9L8_HOLLE|nr:Nck-associated protein 5 [Holothuria leucospilota]
MPLSFDRWNSERRKKDEKERKEPAKKDKKRKKPKSKEEELLEAEIEELKCQLVDERQSTRREKLNCARLQKELSECQTKLAMKETLAQALVQEQEQRRLAEERLGNVLADNETYKAQLVHLKRNSSVTEKADKEKQEKLQNGSVMTSAGPNNNGEVEPRIGEEESIVQALQKEKALLLERLRVLESGNSALVLEGEKQQEVYERCLDEVASQVVQALLIQRELKEECTKLRNRVEELEIQNRQLRHLFEQEVWSQKQIQDSCFTENGSSISHQLIPDNAGLSQINAGSLNGHHQRSMSAIYKHTFFSQTEMHHLSHHLLTSHLNGNKDPRIRDQSSGNFHRQASLPNSYFCSSLPPGHPRHNPFCKNLPSSSAVNSYEGFAGGGECLGSSDAVSDLGNFDSACLNPSGNQISSTCGVSNMLRKTQSLPTTPLTQRSAAYRSHLNNQTTFEFTENQNHLSDKYTKPFVHAPLDYAQSLLQELQEIGASMKTFETLTLEPRANPSQKRKVFGELEQTPQPQKLVKGHGFDYLRSNCSSSIAENADTFSLEDFPPESTSSIASGESIETAYERIIPSPEKSPQKNNLTAVSVTKIGGTPSRTDRRGDALYDIDEKLLENEQKPGGQIWSSYSAFSRPVKSHEENSKSEETLEVKSSETKVPDVNRTETVVCPNLNNAQELADAKVVSSGDSEDLQMKTVPPKVDNILETKKPSVPTTEIEVLVDKLKDEAENLDLKEIDEGVYEKEIHYSPQWEELRDDVEEEPPSLPPRCRLINRSFDSISDDVFLGDGDSSQLCSMDGDRKEAGEDERHCIERRNSPPKRPPKPLWMRMANINLSPSGSDEAVSPPPVPERRPIQPEGQECHSWQWTEDFGTSEMDNKVSQSHPHTTDYGAGAVSAEEKVQELSANSDPEEESIEYLAMWKAREKPPSWTTPFNQDDVKTSTPAANSHPESHIPKRSHPTGTREEAADVGGRVTAMSASTPQVGDGVTRPSSGNRLPDGKPDKLVQKKKSSIPLFKSKKDSSRKPPNVKEKSVVKDIVSSIKAVMDSKGGDKIKGGNPLRRSLRNKTQKGEKNEDKKVVGNGHCNKGISQVKGHDTSIASSKKDKTSSKLPRVIAKQPQVPNKVDPVGKGKPFVASSKQQSVKGTAQNIKAAPKTAFNQTSPLQSEITSKGNSLECSSLNSISNGKQSIPVRKDIDNACRDKVKEACKEETTAPAGENKMEAENDKLAPQNLKWQLDLKSSKGSLNLDLSESEFSKSRRSSVESLGSIGSFTVEGVPFIDDPGNSPDPDTTREIQELSEKFSKLSNIAVNQGGASPDDVTDSTEKESYGHKSDFNISVESDKCTGGMVSGNSSLLSVKQKRSPFSVDQKEIDDIKKGKLVRDYDPVSYNLNILANRSAFTLPTMGKNYSDPQLSRSKIKSLSRGHSPPERQGKMTQSDSDLQGTPKYPLPSSHPLREEKVIHVPLVNGEEIFDGCDEVAMDENASLENGGEHEAQLSEKERATLLDSLFETDSDEEADDGSCSQDASELTSSDSHPDEKEFLRLLEEKGDAKRHVVRQVNTHNRVSLMHVDLCSMFNRYGDKERQALSSFDFLEKVLSQDLDGEQPYLDELKNGSKTADSQYELSLPKLRELRPPLQLSDINRSYPEDTQGGDGQVSPFAMNNEVSNTSMSSSLSTGSLSS